MLRGAFSASAFGFPSYPAYYDKARYNDAEGQYLNDHWL